jgi:subtilisin family serine protease
VRDSGVLGVAATNSPDHGDFRGALSRTMAHLGVRAPGAGVTSAEAGGGFGATYQGSSVAAAIVAGAVALLRSVFPGARASDVVRSIRSGSVRPPGRTLLPPLVDCRHSFQLLSEAV